MNLHINMGNLPTEMRKNGIGRVKFKTSIYGRLVNMYYAIDVGYDMILCVDPEEETRFFVLESKERNNIYSIAIDEFYRIVEFFSEGFDCVGNVAKGVLIAQGRCAEILCHNINEWVRFFVAPDYKETEKVDYTTLPRLILGERDKGKYFYTVKHIRMLEKNYLKSCLAFGKDVADMFVEMGETPNWIEEPEKENIEKLKNILKDKALVDGVVCEGSVRYIKYRT